MLLPIGLIGVLALLLILSESRGRYQAYALRRRHMESLMRLDDQVKVSLPPEAGELVSAAINEELDEVT
jgi:hypothetical protein